MPIIASVQPIDEQRGIVYFQNIRAVDARGNISAGQRLVDPKTGAVTPAGYASNSLENVSLTLGFDGTEKSFTFVLAAKPVLRESFRGQLTGGTVKFEDVGPAEGASPDAGIIMGVGCSGTINYISGSVTLNFAVAPAASGVSTTVSYQQNFEASTDIPQVESFMDSTDVAAKVYALKGTIGMLQNYAMSKRWGNMVMEDELSRILVSEMNKEIGGDAIRMLRANALTGPSAFSKTVPVGASYSKTMHYNDFLIHVADAEKLIVDATQRGSISVLVVGNDVATVLKTIVGFELLYESNKIGPHVYGKIGNLIIVRVPETAVLGAQEGMGLHKGVTPWEAGCVYAPFMPLAMTDMLPTGANPLVTQKAAACMAGLKSVMPNFAVKIDVTA